MITIAFGLSTSIQSQVTPNQNTNSQYYFGFNLMPTLTGDLITYAIVEVKDSVVVGAQPMDKRLWFKLACGEEIHPANPDRVHLFREYQVDSCWVHYDAFYFKYDVKKYVGFECKVMDLLWKIRYKSHPTEFNLNGWSQQAYMPSDQQFQFLNRYYGIGTQATYCYGENMFQLFRDMNDPDWESYYRIGDMTWESVPLKAATDEEKVEDSEEDKDEEAEEKENEEGDDNNE